MPRVATVHGAAPEVGETPGECPFAFPVARVEAMDGPLVTSVYHHSVRLEDRWGREILARADGRRTVTSLREELDALAATASEAEALLWRTIRADLSAVLTRFARQGLIVR